MDCPSCGLAGRRFGRNRNGSQRYQCRECNNTYTDLGSGPPNGNYLPAELVADCLSWLLEGCSIRTVERQTGVNRNTIMSYMVQAGQQCERFLAEIVRGIEVDDVQADEVWAFIGCKERTRERNNYAEWFGDCYCFTAIERDTKLIITYHLGKRSPADTELFAEKLANATQGRFQLTVDGFTPYRTAIPRHLGWRVDFARLVKLYGYPDGDDHRYSPPQVISAVPTVVYGNPDEDRICTSHVERHNLTARMTVRRMTRLTNAFSKKWENHAAMMALFFAYYNYCRPHMTLTEQAGEEQTPAMASGLSSHVWTVAELLAVVASYADVDR